MNAYAVMSLLADIEATSSRTEKDALLERCIDDPFLVEVLKWTCDTFITFGITPPKIETEGRATFDMNSSLVWSLLNGLKTRRITGGAAHDLTMQTMNALNQSGADLLWRILSKDLRCGITGKTVNRLVPGMLPTFDVQLSHKYADKRIKTFPVAMEYKLDGLRAVGLVKTGTGKFFSRVGNHFPALDVLGPAITNMVEKSLKRLRDTPAGTIEGVTADEHAFWWAMLGGVLGAKGPASLALEGEAISGLFNETSGAVRRKSEAAEHVEYHMFDAVPFDFLTDQKQKDFGMPYEDRRKFLGFLMEQNTDIRLRMVPRRLAHSHEEIQSLFEEFRSTPLASYLARGDKELELELIKATTDPKTGVTQTMEGAIVKPLDGIYQKRRSFGWLKIKAEETEDLIVESLFEGEGKYSGQMGGFTCDMAGVKVRVGGGFKDVERIEYWNAPETIIGRTAEIEYHEKTPDGSLRHSRFLRWRDDKSEALRVA